MIKSLPKKFGLRSLSNTKLQKSETNVMLPSLKNRHSSKNVSVNEDAGNYRRAEGKKPLVNLGNLMRYIDARADILIWGTYASL